MNSVVVLLLTLRSNGSRKLIHLCGLEILYSLKCLFSSPSAGQSPFYFVFLSTWPSKVLHVDELKHLAFHNWLISFSILRSGFHPRSLLCQSFLPFEDRLVFHPACAYFVCLLVNVWVISTSWVLWVMLPWIWLCWYLLKRGFSLFDSICPEIRPLHSAALALTNAGLWF